MYGLYRTMYRDLGRRANLFLEMLDDMGGYDTALNLIHRPQPSRCYSFLRDSGRLDLAVEALVLEPQWFDVFSDTDRLAAYRRLESYNYDFPADSWHP